MIPPLLLILIASAVLVGTALWAALFTVPPRTTAIVCRKGFFIRQASAGLHIKIPWIERVVGTVAHDSRKINVTLAGAQTLDPIEIRLVIAIEYFVLEGRAHDVFFDESDISNQIESALRVAARNYIPEWKLADLLAGNAEVAACLQQQLDHAMRGLGYGLRSVDIVDVDFDGQETARASVAK